ILFSFQAYRIIGEKEKAVLYLHMVLRKQFEKGDYSPINWSNDTTRMATVIMVNLQSFDTARYLLVASTTVLRNVSSYLQSTDEFKQAWADLGRSWIKLGVEILDASVDRLKDLEDQVRKPSKY